MDQGHIKTSYSKIWYKRVGTSTPPDKTPMLCLHGGPGLSSEYLRELETLGDEREVVFYDQSGCGRSSRVPIIDCTIERYTAEIDTVRKRLGLDEIVLFGHSWGGTLAMAYLTQNSAPSGVRAAILASPMVSTLQWTEDMVGNAKTLPKKLADALIMGNPRRSFERAQQRFLKQYTPHRHNDGYESSISNLNHDIRQSLWGDNLFVCSGTLRGHDARYALSYMHTPTLITTGTFDGISPTTAEEIATSMPCAETAVFRGAGHFAHIDYPKRYVARIRHFLHDYDA